MHKLSKDIDRQSLEIIYESFIRSELEYACFVWDDCSELDHIALEKCQLRAARIVTGAKKGTSHDKLYTETQWPKLHERREKFKLCFMHKVANKSAPNYLVEILSNAVNVTNITNYAMKMTLSNFNLEQKNLGSHYSQIV